VYSERASDRHGLIVQQLMLSDTKTFFSENYGWQAGPNKGDRTGRWAMIVEKDGTISYAENEGHLQEVKVRSIASVDSVAWF